MQYHPPASARTGARPSWRSCCRPRPGRRDDGQSPSGRNFDRRRQPRQPSIFVTDPNHEIKSVEARRRLVDSSRGRQVAGDDAGDPDCRGRGDVHRVGCGQYFRARCGHRCDQVEARDDAWRNVSRRGGWRWESVFRPARQHADRARPEDRRDGGRRSLPIPLAAPRARRRSTTTVWSTSASAVARVAYAGSSAPTTQRPVKRSGSSGPCRPGSAATRPGKVIRGNTAAGPCGRIQRSIPIVGMGAYVPIGNIGQSLSFIGGTAPRSGCHSVIDKPLSVSRVAPPTMTIARMRPATNHNHSEIARLAAASPMSGTVRSFSAGSAIVIG